MLETFKAGLDSNSAARRVDIPFEDTHLPAIFYPAQNSSGVLAPCLIHLDGLDVMKEYLYLLGIPQAYAERGGFYFAFRSSWHWGKHCAWVILN